MRRVETGRSTGVRRAGRVRNGATRGNPTTVRLALVLLAVISTATPASAQGDPGGRAARAAQLRARGDAHVAAGDRGSAVGWYRDAISADPTDALAYERLGRIYLERGSFGDARAVLEAGAARRPDHPGLARALADLLERMGATADAARVLREMARRAPDDGELQIARAELAQRRGAWSEALDAYRAVVAMRAAGAPIAPEAAADAERHVVALRLLVGGADPVRGGCERASSVRRALAGCP